METRKGSMLEAEKKSLKTAKIVMGVVTLLVFSMCYFGVPHTYLHYWHERASGGAKLFGGVLFGLAFITLFTEGWISNKFTSETLWYVVWIALLVFGIATSSGFNFTLPE